MINLGDEFPSNSTSPNTNYPYGGARDVTIPGDNTGTPFKANLYNDVLGLQQFLMNESNIVPDGNSDNAVNSQQFESFWKILNARTFTHNMNTDADYTLTASDNLKQRIVITDTSPILTTNRNIVVDTVQRRFIVRNETLQDLTFKTLSGTGIKISPNKEEELYCNGINVIFLAIFNTNKVFTVDTIEDMLLLSAINDDAVIVKDLNRGGTFIYDATQSAVNNGGTIFDGWVRQYSGAIKLRWFGVEGDGLIADSLIIKNVLGLFDSIEGHYGDIYNIGEITGDTAFVTRTTPIHIDWKGAKIQCTEEVGVFTGTSFLKLEDCNGSMINYEFEDTSFAFGNASRGVAPVVIKNINANTSNYTFGNFNIIKGQSLLTCFSDNPETARASNINFVGYCNGVDCYYGLNLAKNGDNFTGSYSVEKFNRLIFVYDVKNVKAVCNGIEGQPSSANVLISHSGGNIPTENINAIIRIQELGGPISIMSQTSALGGGTYRNVNLDLSIKELGVNMSGYPYLCHIGAYDVSGIYSSGTIEASGIKLSGTLPEIDNKVSLEITTDSPNYGLLDISELSDDTIKSKGAYIKGNNGIYVHEDNIDLSSYVKTYDITKAFTSNINLTVSFEILVKTRKDTSTFAQDTCIAKYACLGYISSSGGVAIVKVSQIYKYFTTTSPTITITNSATLGNIDITISGYPSTTTAGVYVSIDNVNY